MPEIMEKVRGYESIALIGEMLVKLAFKRPRCYSSIDIETEIIDFESNSYAACIDAEKRK